MRNYFGRGGGMVLAVINRNSRFRLASIEDIRQIWRYNFGLENLTNLLSCPWFSIVLNTMTLSSSHHSIPIKLVDPHAISRSSFNQAILIQLIYPHPISQSQFSQSILIQLVDPHLISQFSFNQSILIQLVHPHSISLSSFHQSILIQQQKNIYFQKSPSTLLRAPLSFLKT